MLIRARKLAFATSPMISINTSRLIPVAKRWAKSNPTGLIADRFPGESQDSKLKRVEFFGGKIHQEVLDFGVCPFLVSQSFRGFGFASLTAHAACHDRKDQRFDAPESNTRFPGAAENGGKRRDVFKGTSYLLRRPGTMVAPTQASY